MCVFVLEIKSTLLLSLLQLHWQKKSSENDSTRFFLSLYFLIQLFIKMMITKCYVLTFTTYHRVSFSPSIFRSSFIWERISLYERHKRHLQNWYAACSWTFFNHSAAMILWTVCVSKVCHPFNVKYQLFQANGIKYLYPFVDLCISHKRQQNGCVAQEITI